MTTQSTGTFQFDYSKYETPGISTAQLDMLANAVFNPNGLIGYPLLIWSAVKLVLAFAYIFARDKLVSQQMQVELQNYQRNQTNQNQNEVNHQ